MDTILSLRDPAASESEAFAQPLELRADPFAAEFPLEPGDGIGARLGAQLCESRHVTYARVFGRRSLRLYLRRRFRRSIGGSGRGGSRCDRRCRARFGDGALEQALHLRAQPRAARRGY